MPNKISKTLTILTKLNYAILKYLVSKHKKKIRKPEEEQEEKKIEDNVLHGWNKYILTSRNERKKEIKK